MVLSPVAHLAWVHPPRHHKHVRHSFSPTASNVGIAPQYLLRMAACQQDIEFTLLTAKIKLRQLKIHTSAIEHDNIIDLKKPVHQGRVSLGTLRPAGDERILQPQMCATS